MSCEKDIKITSIYNIDKRNALQKRKRILFDSKYP